MRHQKSQEVTLAVSCYVFDLPIWVHADGKFLFIHLFWYLSFKSPSIPLASHPHAATIHTSPYLSPKKILPES